mmetsp:Transcript_19045/g.57736  ORF Transcript_19045/g.57736 Transcript_19045/m.57736 type:complete len:222 (-) Transcript_19045:622-1287(-)
MFLAARRVAVGVKRVRFRPADLEPALDRRRREDDVAARDDVLGAGVRLDGHVLHGLAHEHDERRVHAQRLLHAVVEQRHLVEVAELERSRRVDDARLLARDARAQRLVREDVELRPRRRHARRVLAREEQRDQEARDLVVGRARAVLVDHVHEDLEDVRPRGGLLRRLRAARLDDVREERHHLEARGVALPVALDGRRRPEERQRRDPLVEVVVDLAHFCK